MKETESFYKCLYSKKNNESEHTELDSYIDSDAVTKLTNVESEKLEGLLSFAEISETLLKMKNDKNPGLSGFSADFFLSFLEAFRSVCFEINKLWLCDRKTFRIPKTGHNNMHTKRK